MNAPRRTRRQFLKQVAAVGGTALLAACGSAPAVQAPEATTAPAAAEATAAPVAAEATAAPAAESSGGILNGVTLPADAAPPEYQVYVTYYDSTADFTTIDFMESVYKRGGATSDLLSEPLVRINKDFEVQPGAATKWTSNSEGTEWTFELDPNLVWSDGTPLTADDYVATFRYAADPKHAWDFTWYFSAPGAITNWDDVVAGKKPLDQLGVRADGPNKVVFTTETPAPFLPAKLLYSAALQKKALEAHGGAYNSEPATSVSSGPYVLAEWSKGERVVYQANPTYKGNIKPFIQKVISIGAKAETNLAGYQAGEVDSVAGPNLQTADIEIVMADPDMAKEVRPNAQDFRTDYLFFDTKNPPFNDIKVRQAFSHIVDRDTLISKIVTPTQGIPAYSFLMPGFPAANSEALSSIQNYDPAKAKALLAEAGFPDGQGFPMLTLWLRNENAVRQALAQAIAATIKQELNIDVEVSNKENKTFTDAMNAKPTQIQFGMVSYGMDYLDPSNMLAVWLGGGRHNWENADYDKLVKDASAELDQAKRTAMFQDAEKLLVTEAPGVFIYHRTVADLLKPYVKGSELEPNKAGSAAIQWPGFSTFDKVPGTMYISSDVTNFRQEPPK
jgi:ABC-type transport system substrate-binding protein